MTAIGGAGPRLAAFDDLPLRLGCLVADALLNRQPADLRRGHNVGRVDIFARQTMGEKVRRAGRICRVGHEVLGIRLLQPAQRGAIWILEKLVEDVAGIERLDAGESNGDWNFRRQPVVLRPHVGPRV